MFHHNYNVCKKLLADANRHTVFQTFLPGCDENETFKFLRIDNFREIAIHDSGDDLHS